MDSLDIFLIGIIIIMSIFALPTIISDYRKERSRKKI